MNVVSAITSSVLQSISSHRKTKSLHSTQSVNYLPVSVDCYDEMKSAVAKSKKAMFDICIRRHQDDLFSYGNTAAFWQPQDGDQRLHKKPNPNFYWTLSTMSFSSTVHGLRSCLNKSPQPITARVRHFKHKLLFKGKGKKMEGTDPITNVRMNNTGRKTKTK